MAFSYADYAESEEVKKRRQEAEAHQVYKEAEDVTKARDALRKQEANKVADWTGGTYGDALKSALDKINNREKFTYDLNGDALYQQYKSQYILGGKLAMMDTLGQTSALTGGYGNSYGVTAGNQAYQSYLQKLNDKVPELYQMALDQYNREGDDLYNQYNLYNNAYQREYGEHRDQVADWNTEVNRLTDRYNNERNFDYSKFTSDRDYYNTAYNNERNWDYGQYSDAYSRAFSNYQQGVSESQFAQNLALQQAQLNETIRANKANEAYRNASLAAQQAQAAASAQAKADSDNQKAVDKAGKEKVSGSSLTKNEIITKAQTFYSQNPDAKVNDATVDVWANNNGITGEAKNFLRQTLIELGMKSRVTSKAAKDYFDANNIPY